MNYTLDYTPTDKQALFHASCADEVLYGGAAGGGKSRAIVMEAAIDALEHDGIDAYLFRRTYGELESTLIAEALRCIPKELYKYSKVNHDMRFHNGSCLHFRFCRNLEDALKYQGTEMHRIYIDELTHFTQEVYDYLKTRLRAPKRLNVKPKIRLTTNPGGVGHGWVKNMFIDSMPPFTVNEFPVYSEVLGIKTAVTRQYIPAYATDNPHLNPEYIIELEQKPPALRKALLLGDWNVFEGQVFAEFVNDPKHYHDRLFTHVIEPFVIPDDWQRYRSLDWGYSRPFSVGYWAQDREGRLYRYAEIYGSPKDSATGITRRANTGMKMPPHEVASLIRKYEDKYEKGRHIIGIADPSIFDESRGSDGCIAAILERQGIYFEGGDNERIAGKMQIHHRLAFDERGVPMLYVFKTCRDFIRTLPALTYDVNRVEDINTDGEDHIYDETRYMCMYKPIYPERKKEQTKQGGFDPLELFERPRVTNPYAF